MTNVELKDIRGVFELTLPSFPKSKIEMYDGLLFGQMKQIGKAKDDFDRGILVLQHIIKSWNFVDKEGKELEVNEKTLNQFPLQDLKIMMDKANEILEKNLKKNEKTSKK